MMKHNPENERVKRSYLIFMKQAKRQDESSLDSVAMAISRFEYYTNYKNFKAFHFQQAIGFKEYLAKQDNKQTGNKLSKATLHSITRHLKIFFQWLAMQSGYKSRINYTDTEYFNLSEKDTRIAMARHEKPVPTVEQIKHTIECMPLTTNIERRNRALMAFTLLTGVRDSAIASLKIKHIDLISHSVFQDAREVKTKFSKTFTSYFFPVGEDVKEIVIEWINYLKSELLFGNDDPLFPKTNVIQGRSKTFEPSGFKKENWKTAAPIRKIFKQAFTAADLPYFNPHSFRKTLGKMGQKLCRSPEEFKAWSQNLGHEGVLTTLYSYGDVQLDRQAEIIKHLNSPIDKDESNVNKVAEALFKKMSALNAGQNL
ncbi:MAG: recombinase XerC [endosymbiont of Galathealinum brachiosum]|uniref:Recombinase XerC n=1 Tax=endosymbiont of Galathealinum brachiosum TaxID=2200906 RepID=A0A370D730_9GAMM|nr:MAG: recombinase XerC [endosymbiont of Galathealinum brachiosum]